MYICFWFLKYVSPLKLTLKGFHLEADPESLTHTAIIRVVRVSWIKVWMVVKPPGKTSEDPPSLISGWYLTSSTGFYWVFSGFATEGNNSTAHSLHYETSFLCRAAVLILKDRVRRLNSQLEIQASVRTPPPQYPISQFLSYSMLNWLDWMRYRPYILPLLAGNQLCVERLSTRLTQWADVSIN